MFFKNFSKRRRRSVAAGLAACLLAGCSWVEKSDPPVVPPPVSQVPGQVVLQWKGEPELKGFNLHRRTENSPARKINTVPIRPLQEYTGGRTLDNYEYIDRDVYVGEVYYYQYEEIKPDGTTTLWPTPVQKVGAAASAGAERSP